MNFLVKSTIKPRYKQKYEERRRDKINGKIERVSDGSMHEF